MNNYQTAQAALAILFCHCQSTDNVTFGDFKAIVGRVSALMDDAAKAAIDADDGLNA